MSEGSKTPEADKTVTRQGPNDDPTQLREEPRAKHAAATILRQPGGGRPSPSSSAEPDQTLVRAGKPVDPDATVVRSSQGPAVDGETLLRPLPPRAPARPEAHRTPHATADDATVMRDPDAGDDAATRVLGGAADSAGAAGDEATVINTALNAGVDDDQTLINSQDNDATVIGGATGVKIDTTYIASIDKDEKPRGNSEAGRLLKNRFVLEEKIGSGGMGDVYKALDLRQQEAQERNPYIAIKILNENFSRHKDAFISLQREATRTRGIPHPNIMGVYDFDREGDTVFMSMELLDGQPLDDYLKDHPEGVSIEDAWNIIDGICKGLSRAHDAGIVHSDFKPGNIYYTTEKSAKVFDFGIARAVANPGDLESDGEKTVFDAGSLGALTPTYASYEMLTGKEPTKSDDVYAVALVAYELFTGKHPYNRVPADKALKQGLVPERIPFLRKRHWRALKKALALKGEERTQSVDEFYAGVFSLDPPYIRYGLTAAVLVGAIGFGVYSSLYGGTTLPEEMTQMQGVFDVNLGTAGERLQEARFDSQDWQEQLRVNLARSRGVSQQLEAQYGELLDDTYTGTGNRRAAVEARLQAAETETLRLYLAEVGRLRDAASVIAPGAVAGTSGEEIQQQLQGNIDTVQSALDLLNKGEALLDYARQNHNYDGGAIREAEGPLQTAIELRRTQRTAVEAELARAIDRSEAAEAARLQMVAAEERRRLRNEQYLQQLASFQNILKCKGDMPDTDITELGRLFGAMQSNYPEQYELDKPGFADALAGCIEQRIAVRLPDRARQVQLATMAFLPGQAALANVEINDLDPCAARNLEGQGIRNRSWCTDKLAFGGVGPELVVIPAKPGSEVKTFAISRIEIRVGDYNQYCEQAACDLIEGANFLPATDISLQQAQSYIAWLADQSGKPYRLPTTEEWLHAATTSKVEEVDDNVNCSVDSRGVRLGEKLLNTLSGRPNRWGLYNFVGNAREWATEGEALYALGGAHTDPRAECTVQKRVAHSGDADDVTGFRIMRQISS